MFHTQQNNKKVHKTLYSVSLWVTTEKAIQFKRNDKVFPELNLNLSFFEHNLDFFQCPSRKFEFHHNFRGFIRLIYVLILSYILRGFTVRSFFSEFISVLVFLLVTIKILMLRSSGFIFLPNKFISQAQTRSCSVYSHLKSVLVSLKTPTVQMQGKALGNGDTNYLFVSEDSEQETNRKSNKMFSGRQQSKDVKILRNIGN